MNRRQLYFNDVVAIISFGFASLKEESAVMLNDESAKRATCGLRPELFERRHSDGLKQQVVPTQHLQLPHQFTYLRAISLACSSLLFIVVTKLTKKLIEPFMCDDKNGSASLAKIFLLGI